MRCLCKQFHTPARNETSDQAARVAANQAEGGASDGCHAPEFSEVKCAYPRLW
jgi:hypothetical protein